MIPLTLLSSLPLLFLLLSPPTSAQYDADSSGYKLQTPPLTTDWTEKVGTDPWVEYPRPQQVREQWQSLNGIWRYQKANSSEDIGIVPRNVGQDWGRAVMVPSCIESGLSGLQVDIKDNEFSWFQTKFDVPSEWKDQSLLINFGAVDYEATVFVNGKNATTHKGGFTRFDAEISSLVEYGQENEISVFVHDPTDSEEFVVPVGKQTRDPSHIFYTPCSGIWQSVFIEPVPKTYILRIDLSGDMDGVGTINVHTSDSSEQSVKLSISDSEGTAYETNENTETSFNFTLPNVRLWSPDSPTLYNVTVTMGDDVVDTYMGFRSIASGVVSGIMRPLLNGEFIFAFGTLDQGYWPDGLYTPPSYEALKFDLQFLKEMGFNMVRKHIKVETDLFYRACDELGLLVIQDMPSTTARKDFRPNQEQQAQFVTELRELVNLHKSFPSIFTWVIYNEGWGQPEDGPEVKHAPMVKDLDPTRLVDATSGWNDHRAGDYSDNHHYPDPQCGIESVAPPSGKYDAARIGIQGEFGGLSYNVSIDHLWNVPKAIAEMNQTYEIDETLEEWNTRSRDLLGMLESQVTNYACSGAVWTQTVDVEGEINGLMTYDRRMERVDKAIWKEAIQNIFSAATDRGAGSGSGSGGNATKTSEDGPSSSSAKAQSNVATSGLSTNETRKNSRGSQIKLDVNVGALLGLGGILLNL
ncbi:hypothetical protein I302_104318 [Kwoniella bestiolae CBS 10118]|uniref:Beta-galactosidase n=1 Tax=Kwoniella bestiolae CBS 10118 TaxID=1296100 RepID=A0A1B9GAX9_9TREE|nr:hypothetical protein I302_03026 [Kwoniella bestiolae CBS 10118]OCF28175.1 hypothetical protein I302_03026 [Kwoniella bestiolae CBS 10118]